MLTSGVVLLHDNAIPHTAACTRALLDHFNWRLFGHRPYSPNFAPSDYNLFIYLKNWLWSQHSYNNDKIIEGVKRGQANRRQASLIQAHKNLFPGTSASIPAMTKFER
jgi:transposase